MRKSFRLLSTKILSTVEKKRAIHLGLTYSEWNFVTPSPLPFSVQIDNEALIFTSQNAVKTFLQNASISAKRCFCVGEKTKLILEKSGHKVVKMSKNAALLAEFILKNEKNEKFIFFTGTQRMPHIERKLHQADIPLEVIEVYTTQASPKAVGNFDGILFFSPSGVTSFLQKNKLHDATCFAIGKTTAHALAPHTNSISIASEPTVSHLMALVKQHINS